MKKSKFKGLKRLLVLSLLFALLVSESSITALASITTEAESETEDSHTIVIFDEEGNATYQTITTQDSMSVNSDEAIVIEDAAVNTETVLENDNEIATVASSISSIPEHLAVLSPYSYCCIISSTFPDGTTMQSSGILLGKNVVLASAHGVYNHDRGGNSTYMLISVGAYYNSAGQLRVQHGTTTRKQIVVDRGWVEERNDKSDWALILLNDNYNLSSYPRYGYVADYTNVNGRTIDLVGYPGEQFCFSQGEITGTTDYKVNSQNRGLWTTSAGSSGGMSGGPMFDVQTGAVIGVIKGKSGSVLPENVCVPITEFLNNLIMTYKYQ